MRLLKSPEHSEAQRFFHETAHAFRVLPWRRAAAILLQINGARTAF
jgi:hypothetical protein